MGAEHLLHQRALVRGGPPAKVLRPIPLDALSIDEEAGVLWLAARPGFMIDAPEGEDLNVRRREGIPTVVAESVLRLESRYFRLVDRPGRERRIAAPPDAYVEDRGDEVVLVHSEDSDLLWLLDDERRRKSSG